MAEPKSHEHTTDNDDWKEWVKEDRKKRKKSSQRSAGALGFIGFIGSLVYWWQAAHNFGAVVTGFLKSCVWPAYLVYHLLVMFYGKVR